MLCSSHPLARGLNITLFRSYKIYETRFLTPTMVAAADVSYSFASKKYLNYLWRRIRLLAVIVCSSANRHLLHLIILSEPRFGVPTYLYIMHTQHYMSVISRYNTVMITTYYDNDNNILSDCLTHRPHDFIG